jgi:spore germination protein YaaH
MPWLVPARMLGVGIAVLLGVMATPAHVLATGLQAFVLTGAPDSLTDLEVHAQDIGVVYPTDYACALGSGRVVGEGAGEAYGERAGGGQGGDGGVGGGERGGEEDAIAAYARGRGIAVMPRFNCQDGATVHAILTDRRVRARALAELASIAKSSAYTGINLDLENDTAADRDAMSAFVDALAGVLHREGRKLSVDVVGVTHEEPSRQTGLYDDRAIVRAADYMFVIAWGTHWEGSGPGPIAPVGYVAAVARFAASLPHARSRIVLGVPMYGLDWPISAESVPRGPVPGGPVQRRPISRQSPATALQYSSVLALLHASGAGPVLDRSVDEPTFTYARAGVGHRVWYMNAQSIADRLRLARDHGLQAGVWRLGEEDQALWSSA